MNALEAILRDAVAAGAVRGVSVAVGNRAGTLAEAAAGERAPGAAMAPDTVVWLASMTKAITTIAVLQQVEDGALTLDDPIGAVLPELGEPLILEGFSDAGEALLRPARRSPTIRQMLTHTAGFSYNTWNANTLRYMNAHDIPSIRTCERKALGIPLSFEPGTAWEYGIGIDWAGQAVEAVTGQRLGTVLAERVLGPLRMDDTAFRIGTAQRARLSAMYRRDADGSLSEMPFEIPQDPEFDMGGGGLYGTARDYLRLCRMVLNDGALDGERLLSQAMVAESLRDNIAPLGIRPMLAALPGASNDVDFFPGMPKGWGLSFLINHEEIPGGRAAGSLAMAGLANTYYWIDPKRDLAGVVTAQVLPFFDPRVLEICGAVEGTAYAWRNEQDT